MTDKVAAGVLNSAGTSVPVTPVTTAVTDAAGNGLLPDSLSHTYAYNTNGQIATDTATDGTNTWVKTYTYTGTQLTGESQWVKQ